MTSEMRWTIYADNVVINLSRLLAMSPDADNQITLLFDSGHTLTISGDAAKSIISALQTWEDSNARTGMACLPQTM